MKRLSIRQKLMKSLSKKNLLGGRRLSRKKKAETNIDLQVIKVMNKIKCAS